MNSCIIESKLEPPSFTAMHLERVRLSALLEQSLSGIGCVVQAPAGYGKTVALSGWYSRLRECGMSCAWLSLDEHDACPGTFLSYFLSACAKAGFRGFDTVGCADTSASGGDELYRLVLPRLARLKRRHVIILDDFHCAASPEVQAFVNRLLRARLRDLTLVLGTRVAPARIALADLRIGGDVREVLGAELAFDKSELGALFAAGGIPLETSLLSDLHARTRGWPVAVIAAYRWALEGASTADVLQRLSGRDKDLSAYFLRGSSPITVGDYWPVPAG
jgi:LuxR family maltose regulon positive regulatory protein